MGLLIAAYIAAVAFVSQSSYGSAVAQSAPLLTSALALPLETLGLLTQPNPSSVQLAAAAGASAPAQIAPNDVAHTALPVSPEPVELIQTLARDLANLEREIEQLKASQQQLASDSAKAIEQIKVSQEQEARDIAKTVELLKASQDQVTQLIARVSDPNLKPKRPVSQPQVAIGMQRPASTPCTADQRTSADPKLVGRSILSQISASRSPAVITENLTGPDRKVMQKAARGNSANQPLDFAFSPISTSSWITPASGSFVHFVQFPRLVKVDPVGSPVPSQHFD